VKEQRRKLSRKKEIVINYHIRELERKDLEEVTALEASCFSMPWKYSDFEEILTTPYRFYLVAASHDEPQTILGGCMLTSIAGEGDITNVAVLEQYRKNNIATSLLSRIIEFGKTNCNITAFTLEVRSKNIPAIRLYEKAGFISEGIRPNFYDQPKDDAVIMWLR
jgi:ribosomal-protein-alanine N-acetyltransferase